MERFGLLALDAMAEERLKLSMSNKIMGVGSEVYGPVKMGRRALVVS